jgi:hypothetical protein
MKVGHIDCTKDTYDVLKSTVAGPLNNSLKEVINSGALQVIRDENGGIVFQMNNVYQDDEPLTSLPIQVFVTGDLAYFAAILGKVNMAGGWCTWCSLLPKEWTPTDHDKGELWTLATMEEVWTSISLGVTPDMSANCQGCVNVPLWTCVPINSYILPIIHTEIGIGNRLLKSFLDWVDLQIENVPDNEIEARYGVYESQVEVQIQT